jgi:hypothetical protein
MTIKNKAMHFENTSCEKAYSDTTYVAMAISYEQKMFVKSTLGVNDRLG